MLVLERLDCSVNEALRDKLPLDPQLVAADVARGMMYLHSLALSHRDLKAANVLLDGQRAKVCIRHDEHSTSPHMHPKSPLSQR